MKRLLYLLVVFSSCVFAQQGSIAIDDSSLFKYRYDTDLLPASFHKKNRDTLRKKMPANSVAVFFANPVRNRSNDVDFQYHQDPNFYYLTGYIEPDAILLVFKEEQKFDSFQTNEIIFVRQRSMEKEIWNGRRLGVNGVKKMLGFENVFVNNSYNDAQFNLCAFDKILVQIPKNDIRDNPNDRGDLYSLVNGFKVEIEKCTLNTDAFSLAEIMAEMREVKQAEELVLMRKAIEMSCLAHIELIKALEPLFTEYQAQAVVEYMFKKYGSEYVGYPSIVGGAENSCVLHYSSNRKQLNNEKLLLLDMGAEYHGYTADITRTLPVSGTFSIEEKTLYNVVLAAQSSGIKACLEGNNFWEPHNAAVKIIQSRLLELGIIKDALEYRKYFMHGTSHYLGLDVHDVGLFGKLEAGNIITVEPGIYIPEGSDCDKKWWNIGIRIEDDILISAGKPINLSESIPRNTDEIEKLMKEKSFFNEQR